MDKESHSVVCYFDRELGGIGIYTTEKPDLSTRRTAFIPKHHCALSLRDYGWIYTISGEYYFNNEPIEFALLIKGSDGNFYSNVARSRFPSTDGWVIAAGWGNILILDIISLDNIRSRRWWRSETQVDLTIEWYRLERTEVDRESEKTPRASPYPPGYRDQHTGRNFIRYYLAHIRFEGEGWGQTFSLPTGGIIAPMVCIRWEEGPPNDRRVVHAWLPGSNSWAPLPGMNDCLGLRRWDGECQGAFSEPVRRRTYNQHYGRRGLNWAYSERLSGFIYWVPFYTSLPHPVQYPVFVFKNIGALTQGHSMLGLNSTSPPYYIRYDSPEWWRVHQATIYEGAPYEWGGKYYAAEASGLFSSYNEGGRGTSLGFGLDCSGLITVAKGFPNDTRYGTGAIVRETYPISWDEVRPGDVLIRHREGGGNNHVMLVIRVEGVLYGGRVIYRYHCIEAVGADENEPWATLSSKERVRYSRWTKDVLLGDHNDPNDDFQPRRFR